MGSTNMGVLLAYLLRAIVMSAHPPQRSSRRNQEEDMGSSPARDRLSVAQGKRMAAKRRNVLRNRAAHKGK